MKPQKLTAGILAAALSAAFCGTLTSQALYTEYGSEIIQNGEVINSERSIPNYRPMELPTTKVSKHAKNMELPEQYDPRGHKSMTTVKNQGEYGTCWSFSSIASIESSLFDLDPYVDLSEWYQATYMYKKGIGYPVTSPELSVYDQGSMLESTTALLLRGIGPVNEDDSPYGDENALNVEKDAETLYAEASYRVTDVTYYPYDIESEEFEAQKNAVKLALYRGQELSMSYIDYENAHDEEHHSYYLADQENRWYGSGHAVNIIGWDDHFPADNFVDAPPTDGAWLIKNSWGPEFGENGYFWISYCEKNITDIAAYTAVPAETYSDVYQHDHYGYGASLNHVMVDFDSVASKEAKSAMMANHFVAEKDTMLKAVMFATAMPDENYEITVYTDLTDPANPTSGKAHPVTAGTMCQIGYHTVELSQEVPLTKGKTFSVVVRLSGDMGYHLTGEVCNYGDYVRSDGTALRFGDSAASEAEISDIKKNQSFISLDGNVWEDTSIFREEKEFEVQFDPEFLEPDAEFWQIRPKKLTMMYGNVCIKALTCDTDKVDFSVYTDSLSIGDTIKLSNAEDKAIYYAVNDGEMQLYTEPICFTGEMTIRAHVEGSETIYEQSYRQRSAVITGLSISEVCSDGEELFRSVLFRKNNGYFEGEYGYEVIVPGERILDQLTIKTTGTAEVVCNGVKLQNNEPTVISVNTENLDRALVFHVSAPGMKDSEYVVKLVEALTPFLGDINIDGLVNAQDAAEILVYAADAAANGKPEHDEKNIAYYGDVNFDNEVNALDATWVLIEAAQAGAMKNDELIISWHTTTDFPVYRQGKFVFSIISKKHSKKFIFQLYNNNYDVSQEEKA